MTCTLPSQPRRQSLDPLPHDLVGVRFIAWLLKRWFQESVENTYWGAAETFQTGGENQT